MGINHPLSPRVLGSSNSPTLTTSQSGMQQGGTSRALFLAPGADEAVITNSTLMQWVPSF